MSDILAAGISSVGMDTQTAYSSTTGRISDNKEPNMKAEAGGSVPSAKLEQNLLKPDEAELVNNQAGALTKEAALTQEAALSKEQEEKNAEQEFEQLTENMNSLAERQGWTLNFERHDDSNRQIVKIVDSKDGEVIKTIPSEEFLDTAKRIQQLYEELESLTGIFVSNEV